MCVHVYIKFKKYRQNCPYLWLFAVRQELLQPGQTCGHLHENLCVYKMHLSQPRDPNPSPYLHFHLKKMKGEMKYHHSTSNSAQPPQNSIHAWIQTIPGCSPRWKHHPSPCWHGSSCTAHSFQPALAADLRSLQTPLRYVDGKKVKEWVGFFLLNPAFLAVKEFTELLSWFSQICMSQAGMCDRL